MPIGIETIDLISNGTKASRVIGGVARTKLQGTATKTNGATSTKGSGRTEVYRPLTNRRRSSLSVGSGEYEDASSGLGDAVVSTRDHAT